MIFVESRSFTKRIDELLGDEGYRRLQNTLVNKPDSGVVIPGCDGLRKVRVGLEAPKRGRQAGARVIYLHIPEADRCEMLLLYTKNEREDLSFQEKAVLTELAVQAKLEAVAWAKRNKPAR